MPLSLFDTPQTRVDEDYLGTSDVGTRALSVTAVENDFVTGVYDKLASTYDVFFGPMLHPGRLRAIERMDIKPGQRVLEVGVGTGINTPLYPPDCHVTAIDFSAAMLEKAHERIARKSIQNVSLLEMDAAALNFPDGSFDIVYAPYLINVVSHPVQVACEMIRVCRPGGRLVFLNHFLSLNPVMSRIDRVVAPLFVHLGFKSDFDLTALLAQTGLKAASIEKVNVPRIWSLVTCIKEANKQ